MSTDQTSNNPIPIDQTVLITGGSGNLGQKLSNHLAGRSTLRLLDKFPRHPDVIEADFAEWNFQWIDHFKGVDTVVHLAADPNAGQDWHKLIEPNMDGLINVFTAAAQNGVKRIVYASSNHVMGGYQSLIPPQQLAPDVPPKPGAIFSGLNGETMNSTAYGGAKLFGERIGKTYHEIYGLSTIAVRIGWVRAGENEASTMPPRDSWFRLMWLSNRDFCHLMECCITADPELGFAIINGMSNNTGMRWDLESARSLVGYVPQDDVTKP
ncbi:MAG: NAD(P)-dependent oxidoreductase [Chloroflexota bacterium]